MRNPKQHKQKHKQGNTSPKTAGASRRGKKNSKSQQRSHVGSVVSPFGIIPDTVLFHCIFPFLVHPNESCPCFHVEITTVVYDDDSDEDESLIKLKQIANQQPRQKSKAADRMDIRLKGVCRSWRQFFAHQQNRVRFRVYYGSPTKKIVRKTSASSPRLWLDFTLETKHQIRSDDFRFVKRAAEGTLQMLLGIRANNDSSDDIMSDHCRSPAPQTSAQAQQQSKWLLDGSSSDDDEEEECKVDISKQQQQQHPAPLTTTSTKLKAIHIRLSKSAAMVGDVARGDIQFYHITDDQFVDTLESLRIDGGGARITSTWLELDNIMSRRLTSLQHIDISAAFAVPKGLVGPSLLNLSALVSLRTIRLRFGFASNLGIELPSSLPKLHDLELDGLRGITDSFISDTIPMCAPRLERLVIANNSRIKLPKLRNMPLLAHLELHDLSDLIRISFEEGTCGGRLHTLILCQLEALDDSCFVAETLHLAAALPCLTKLVIHDCMHVVRPRITSESLQELDLSSCEHLSPELNVIEGCPNLRTLNLELSALDDPELPYGAQFFTRNKALIGSRRGFTEIRMIFYPEAALKESRIRHKLVNTKGKKKKRDTKAMQKRILEQRKKQDPRSGRLYHPRSSSSESSASGPIFANWHSDSEDNGDDSDHCSDNDNHRLV